MTEPPDSDQATPAPRWSVEQRTAFAARRLYWDGALSRDDLMRRFGVSANQATADIARLKQAYPDGFAYDTVAKRYRPAAGYRPAEATAAALLRELRLVAEHHLDPQEATLGILPPLEIAEVAERSVDAAVLNVLLGAIRGHRAVRARYVSFRTPGERQRELSPHALVFDGFRWHVRAHDAGDGAFKDFVIARLSRAADVGPARAEASSDMDWNRIVTLEIAPHPGLGDHQKRVIARDYGMDAKQRLVLRVREAVRFYICKRFGLTDGHEQRAPNEQHIVLVRTS
jgi:predicted DNA-binding transcriptional regulator YafY